MKFSSFALLTAFPDDKALFYFVSGNTQELKVPGTLVEQLLV